MFVYVAMCFLLYVVCVSLWCVVVCDNTTNNKKLLLLLLLLLTAVTYNQVQPLRINYLAS